MSVCPTCNQPMRSKRIPDDKRAVLHILLRPLASHLGLSVGALKSVMAQEMEWPLEVVEWKGKTKRVRKETMRLTNEEAMELIRTVENYCIEYGIELPHRGSMADDGGPR